MRTQIFFLDLLLSVFCMGIANALISATLCVYAQVEVSIVNIIILSFMLYIIEMLFILVNKFLNKNNKTKRISRNSAGLVFFEVFISLCVSLVYVYNAGNDAVEKNTELRLLKELDYAITYSDGEQYVIHKVDVEGDTIVIHKNQQMIVNIEGCEYSVKAVEKIVVE